MKPQNPEVLFNYLSHENGARIIEYSSYSRGCKPSNVLNSNPRMLWLSEEGLPQTLTIDISNLSSRSGSYRCFGWYCWHAYSSNPSVLELQSSGDGHSYKKRCIFEASQKQGAQLFSLPSLSSSDRFLKLIVRDTFGACTTYLNQVFLYDTSPSPLPSPIKRMQSPTYQQDDTDYKAKLKAQLSDLEKSLRSLKNNSEIIPESPSPEETLEEEVNSWSSALHAMQNNISKLINSVSNLENNVDTLNRRNLSPESPKFEFSAEWEQHMRIWQDRLSPLFSKIPQKEEGIGEILSKLQEKLEMKAKKLCALQQERNKRSFRSNY